MADHDLPARHERCSAPSGSQYRTNKETSVMLWTILVILLVLWLVGLLAHVGGSLIHLLLVVAVVVLIINLVTGRRAV
jgi:Flp pilus assembly protein TadB